ncbi:DUF2934 domain-containing protein [Sulfitobacter sp. LCG007]
MTDQAHDRRISEKAYQLWEAAGRPDGDPVKFWYEAEAELGSIGEEASARGYAKDVKAAKRPRKMVAEKV